MHMLTSYTVADMYIVVTITNSDMCQCDHIVLRYIHHVFTVMLVYIYSEQTLPLCLSVIQCEYSYKSVI